MTPVVWAEAGIAASKARMMSAKLIVRILNNVMVPPSDEH
jgi:hypothetical protein